MIATAHVQTTCDVERNKNTCVSYICMYTLLSLYHICMYNIHDIYDCHVCRMYRTLRHPRVRPPAFICPHPHSHTHPCANPRHVICSMLARVAQASAPSVLCVHNTQSVGRTPTAVTIIDIVSSRASRLRPHQRVTTCKSEWRCLLRWCQWASMPGITPTSDKTPMRLGG